MLASEIRERGPLSLARYMELALGHPTCGYYRRRAALGASGDFITAPEISQAFGEILALWLAQAWSDLGRPAPARLVELGPGRGTLMADMLRAAARVAGFGESLDVRLVETSPRLQAAQRERLARHEVRWHAAFEEVPPGPLLLVANEFFDALPVRQLVRAAHGWVERRIGLDASDALAFVEDREPVPPATLAQIPGREDAPIGTVAEIGEARAALARAIGARIAQAGGVALIVDYGAWIERPSGDTLQAVRAHAPSDPLDAPGEADLSSQVDFRALAEAARAGGAAVYGPVPQGPFLRALGIEVRTAALLERADPGQRHALRAGLFRLTDASAMGELFKVLVLARPGTAPPPGFGAPTLAP